MQRGTCFINYEDFKECLRAHRKETKSIYSIHSSVSVRHHNSKFSSDIRPDIIFTEVKFCCSKLKENNCKRKALDGVCPAYFLLEYDMELDRLVVKEECSTHVHSKDTNPPQASLDHLPEKGEHLSPDLEVPYKKVCNKSPTVSSVIKNDQEKVQQDTPSLCTPQSNLPLTMPDIGEGHSKPTTAIKDYTPEVLSVHPVSRLHDFIKNFQKGDVGSKSSLTVGGQNQLEQLCFQTSNMSIWFLKFPESLLLHRVSSKDGYVLYAFLVETKERMAKIVHFSFVKEDNAKNISKMLEMHKHFNSEWPKLKVIYTDIAFGHIDILKEAFPSAQILLSVYHTVRHIEKKTKGSADFKHWVHKWMDDAIYHTTPQKLNFLAEKLEHKLDQDLYAKLYTDWFSSELLWYMHVKKGIHACNTYMDSVGQIDETIYSCLSKQGSMENAIQEFLKSADCFNNQGLEKQNAGASGFSRNVFRAKPKNTTKKLHPILPALYSPPSASEVSVKPKKMKATCQPNKSILNNDFFLGPKMGVWRTIKLPNKMLLSLKEFCNDVGFQLCSKEWEVVRRSTHLINKRPNFTAVQILEETHSVSLSGHSCTCYFNTNYKLPCRHILSMLYVYRKPVEENMVSLQWSKKYVKPISNSRVYGKVMHYTKNGAETMARIGMIKSLAKEFYNLLMQCDGPEMQVRVSMLQMMVDRWRNESSGKMPYLAQDEVNELPYRWVKKEPLEGENNSCHELCRMDPNPPLS
ncbi:zinc finger SWIM domain-containing protein 3 [Rhinoderma darwinii]|uniref:zinc finger SWIM domain-containing protein 3 n=1 Tax=Rhinoderma darwinii TaxID=43563 RepID=UPI003F669268